MQRESSVGPEYWWNIHACIPPLCIEWQNYIVENVQGFTDILWEIDSIGLSRMEEKEAVLLSSVPVGRILARLHYGYVPAIILVIITIDWMVFVVFWIFSYFLFRVFCTKFMPERKGEIDWMYLKCLWYSYATLVRQRSCDMAVETQSPRLMPVSTRLVEFSVAGIPPHIFVDAR